MCLAQARNEIGESEWSEQAAFQTRATVPNQPNPPALVGATATAVTLHWPAARDNGAPITHYLLERDNGCA